MNQTHIRVERHYKTKALIFFAYLNARLRDQSRPLVYDNDESSEPKAYDTYEAAFEVCREYEFGLDDGVREARWDYLTGGWEVVETFRSSYGDADREDFHADG